MTTNPKVVFLVIGTAAIMTLLFFLALTGSLGGILFFSGKLTMTDQVAVIFDKVLAAFVTAGMSVMSFFFGTLVNTRSTPSASEPPQKVEVEQPPGKSVPTHNEEPSPASKTLPATAAVVALALLLAGCGTQKQTFTAPDPAKVVEATRKVKTSQKAAHDSHQLATATHKQEREAVKKAQTNAEALGVASVGAMQKLDQLALVVPDDFKPAVAAIHADVTDLQDIELILNANLKAAWAKGDETEKHLAETETHLTETDTNVANLEEEHADYYQDAQGIADKATDFNHKLVAAEEKLSWYRWHWWGSWMALGAGVIACGLFAFVKFTGKSVLGIGSLVARVGI